MGTPSEPYLRYARYFMAVGQGGGCLGGSRSPGCCGRRMWSDVEQERGAAMPLGSPSFLVPSGG